MIWLAFIVPHCADIRLQCEQINCLSLKPTMSCLLRTCCNAACRIFFGIPLQPLLFSLMPVSLELSLYLPLLVFQALSFSTNRHSASPSLSYSFFGLAMQTLCFNLSPSRSLPLYPSFTLSLFLRWHYLFIPLSTWLLFYSPHNGRSALKRLTSFPSLWKDSKMSLWLCG